MSAHPSFTSSSGMFLLCFFPHEVVQRSPPGPSWEVPLMALNRVTEGRPRPLWAAGRAVRPCAWPAPSGWDWRSLRQALWGRGGRPLAGSTAGRRSWPTSITRIQRMNGRERTLTKITRRFSISGTFTLSYELWAFLCIYVDEVQQN